MKRSACVGVMTVLVAAACVNGSYFFAAGDRVRGFADIERTREKPAP